jgi:hypothetical protein
MRDRGESATRPGPPPTLEALGGLGDIPDDDSDGEAERCEQRHANANGPRRAVEISGEGNNKPNGGSGDQHPPSPNDQTEDQATCDESSGDDDLGMMPRHAASETALDRASACLVRPLVVRRAFWIAVLVEEHPPSPRRGRVPRPLAWHRHHLDGSNRRPVHRALARRA